jgi:hypothetical protein
VRYAAQTPQRAERRNARRTPTTLRGKVFPGGLDCIIADYSQTGACLRFTGPPPADDCVVVVIWSTGVALEAERCWGEGADAGWRFSKRFDLRRAVPNRLADVKAQWLDRRPRLRRRQLKDVGVMIDYRGSPRAVRLS